VVIITNEGGVADELVRGYRFFFLGDKPVARIKPAVRHVKEIVPQHIIPKLKPPLTGSLPQWASQLI
jgi:hypothetical protein